MEYRRLEPSKDNSKCKDSIQNRPPFRVLVVYESILACLVADTVCKRISNHSGGKVNTAWCSITKLKKAGSQAYLKNQVEESDLILVVKTESNIVAESFASWLKSLKLQMPGAEYSVLGVFASKKASDLAALPSYRSLHSLASEIGVPFYGTSFPLSRDSSGELQRDFEMEPLGQEFAQFIRKCQNNSTTNSLKVR